MPCLTNSNYLYPITTLHNHLNSNELILPITTNNIEITNSLITNSLHNIHSNDIHNVVIDHHNSLSSSSYVNNNEHIATNHLTSLLTTPEINVNDKPVITYRNIHEAYPKLCQHHQHLCSLTNHITSNPLFINEYKTLEQLYYDDTYKCIDMNCELLTK
ncbi:hypothetical protein EWB00_006660 [Schistosoma japonicum]|uniref:Uncharacterized protein n=1 Tax=Schistosoma japonicum TaxID=6182 RepID=A0A4Z2CXJ4_SCHJA|nr:hypothetical protein EWB00_006660 [Schistosoma japonicum]